MQGGAAYSSLRIVRAPALPIEQMILGKSAEEAADLLPRLFNICRAAQGLAARAAFGLPPRAGWRQELRAEIVREHVVKLCLKWPAALNMPGVAMPEGWVEGTASARVALFGSSGRMPRTAADLSPFMESDAGLAPLLGAISHLFAPGVAVRCRLALAEPQTVFSPHAQENSVAARHAGHPAMQHVETAWGRGALWSALGVALDLEAVWDGWLPEARLVQGCAVVPAARGFYGVSARVGAQGITAFARITPTDHLTASGGALEQSLASLPTQTGDALVPALLSILDPCHPVAVETAPGAPSAAREEAHA